MSASMSSALRPALLEIRQPWNAKAITKNEYMFVFYMNKELKLHNLSGERPCTQ